ncbi:BTB/POZ protein [Xylariaceae sp. AK1471]|nr:BTB/POZ protein [Xylariaceae sp. AK1471]
MTSNGTEGGKYVTLVSSDGFEFVLLRQAVMISPAIKSMLDPRSQFTEARTGRCVFEEISGMVLEKVVEYFHYWYKNKEREDVPDMEIPVELCLELLMAADYLGIDRKGSSRYPKAQDDTRPLYTTRSFCFLFIGPGNGLEFGLCGVLGTVRQWL